MSVLKQKKPRRRVSITSLIDVIFLLLLFFMLSSTFSQFSSVELISNGSSSGSALSDEETATLIVEVSRVRINGKVTDDEQLLQSLTAEGVETILVTPVADVTTQRLIDVLAILRDADNIAIRVVEAR